MKAPNFSRSLLLLAFLMAAGGSLRALDLSAIPEEDAAGFKSALEAEGGKLAGEPYVASAEGPDGGTVKVIVFPTPDCFIEIPVNPPSNHWTMGGAIRVERWAFEISGGAVFGVLFGPNDYVLALGLGKWSKLKALYLLSGLTELISEQTFADAGVPATDSWQRVALTLDASEFRLTVGSDFEKTGLIEADGRAALSRRTNLFMRIGSFQGMAILPELRENL